MFGLVDAYAQGVSPPKAGGYVADPNPVKLIVQGTYLSVSGSFVAPLPGRYQFVLQGAGGPGEVNAQGGPGCLALRVVRLAKGQSVPYIVSRSSRSGSPVDSTVTFVDRTMTAGAGGPGTDDGMGNYFVGLGGVASGGDINVNGIAGASHAASYGAFIGGDIGVDSLFLSGTAPGGPGFGNDTTLAGVSGAGRLIVTFVGP